MALYFNFPFSVLLYGWGMVVVVGGGRGEEKKMFPIFRPLLFPRWQSFMEKETTGIRHAEIESRVVKHAFPSLANPKSIP